MGEFYGDLYLNKAILKNKNKKLPYTIIWRREVLEKMRKDEIQNTSGGTGI